MDGEEANSITYNGSASLQLSFKYSKRVQMDLNEEQNLPALVSVDTRGNEDRHMCRRTPIDLVCVVDNSASMSSENKMKLVRKSLRYLLKILNEKDRIAIITFSMHAKIRSGFLRNSIENKQKIK